MKQASTFIWKGAVKRGDGSFFPFSRSIQAKNKKEAKQAVYTWAKEKNGELINLQYMGVRKIESSYAIRKRRALERAKDITLMNPKGRLPEEPGEGVVRIPSGHNVDGQMEVNINELIALLRRVK